MQERLSRWPPPQPKPARAPINWLDWLGAFVVVAFVAWLVIR